MSRQTGSNNFAGTLEILAGGPIDARLVVPTKADLTVSANFPYPYVGMIVSVSGEGKAYILTATPVTDEDNWDEVGSGSADVELTQAEYDALPASKETDGVNYFVTDGIPASKRIVETGFTPVGTIISVMGTTAPQHYLACDGTIVNIADYPVLASYFEEQFGEVNFFGGDGTTTFALPDLRGEFLRGTGTNSHANQGSGANVGEHQDGTEHTNTYQFGTIQGSYLYGNNSNNYNSRTSKEDSTVREESYYSYVNCSITPQTGSAAAFTSRPTNTSVLYCIATKNIYVDARYDYSLDEKVVGTWIDGSPLYQRTFEVSASTYVEANSKRTFTATIISNATNINMIASEGSIYLGGFGQTINFIGVGASQTMSVSMSNSLQMNDSGNLNYYLNYDKVNVVPNITSIHGYITIRYTKTTD